LNNLKATAIDNRPTNRRIRIGILLTTYCIIMSSLNERLCELSTEWVDKQVNGKCKFKMLIKEHRRECYFIYIYILICITYKPHQYQHCCFSYIQSRCSGAHLLYTEDKNNNNDNICNAYIWKRQVEWKYVITYCRISHASPICGGHRIGRVNWPSFMYAREKTEREEMLLRENEILLQISGYSECCYRG